MPNARVHRTVGTIVGGGVTLLATKELPDEGRAAAVLGGLLGGYVGGALPDVLEPAIHSWHRSACHSGAAGTALIASLRSATQLKNDTLSHAAELRAKRLALPVNHPDRFLLGLQELLLYVTYGAAIGFAAGYTSHLVLDMGTERGIPLICRGL